MVALGVLLQLLVSLEWEQGDVAQRQHVIRALHRQLVLPLQVDRSVLLVRKPLLTQRALKPENIINIINNLFLKSTMNKPVLNPALEPHVTIKVVVPVVALAALQTLERLFNGR